MRARVLASLTSAFVIAGILGLATLPAAGAGHGGIHPVACPQQAWEYVDASFEALPDAKAFFGRYDGGLYRIEIPNPWNGELMLSAHGFVSNGGPQGDRL